ncbi:MAG: OmpA family protein, partial [Bacteroidota bacterium]
NKYDLKPESSVELNRLVKFMIKNPGLKIEIGGHTDNIGTKEYNKQLSEKRAGAVRDYVISKGIAAERMTSVGYGDSKPEFSNDSETGRAQNRRTEVKVLSVQ